MGRKGHVCRARLSSRGIHVAMSCDLVTEYKSGLSQCEDNNESLKYVSLYISFDQ